MVSVSYLNSTERHPINLYSAEAIGEPKAEMKWKNYWRDIVKKHQVMIDGWPDEVPFANLSDVSSGLPVLESLLRKWKGGTIVWKSVSDEEFTRLDEERALQIEAGMITEPARRQRSDKGSKRAHANTDAENPASKRVCRDDPEASGADSTSSSSNILAPLNLTSHPGTLPKPYITPLPCYPDTALASNLGLALPPANDPTFPLMFPHGTPIAPHGFDDILYPSLPPDGPFPSGSFMDLLFDDMGPMDTVEGVGHSFGI